MEVDGDNGLLSRVALGTPVEVAPRPTSEPHGSPLPSSPPSHSSQETSKENAPTESLPATQPVESGALPKQLADMLADIISHLQTFTTYPPHTIQRLAELVLRPRAHYKALATYLHAVDRVVQVTSGINTYPLPPAIPDMSSMHLNGEDAKDPAMTVAWSNPTTAALGTDEALGGALLTPIPWLTRRSPEENSQDTPGAQIHSESTETIDGPNGVGSIETVSVSVNGVPSTGHARGVTQGELLRQEQRAGVVPVSQLSRAQEAAAEEERAQTVEGESGEPHEDEETPHARGPEEIGVNDTGPQGRTTSFVGEDGLEMDGIDVEAAVGRKHDKEEKTADDSVEDSIEVKSPSAESAGTKREAEQDLESESSKKAKDDVEDEDKDATDATETKVEEKEATGPADEVTSEDADDNMDTK
ncbi:hypothetical protein EDB81DRAFT_645127 [Dactylonectria macrodidyma]|uniref:Protein phosphatase 4 core regulatory subunit R2 n=1 Tax=Dactylonectria macrodidyma TaxID=307937 RepID=A0A9P9F6I9_9HYPO|nr:hypothetical protein EDB81DRAFT_645127 [Dactylonectria macrodidyma]